MKIYLFIKSKLLVVLLLNLITINLTNSKGTDSTELLEVCKITSDFLNNNLIERKSSSNYKIPCNESPWCSELFTSFDIYKHINNCHTSFDYYIFKYNKSRNITKFNYISEIDKKFPF